MLTSNHFYYVRKLVQEKSAIILNEEKNYLIESRLGQLAKQEGITLEKLLQQLQFSPTNGMHQKVVEAMTTNETLFFRDFHPFETLKKHILPKLFAADNKSKNLHIWCGACSSGQEPYSLAMLLQEHFSLFLKDWTVKITATDISDKVLEQAKKGVYSQMEVNRGLPAPYLIKYFQKQGIKWQIKDVIREKVKFQRLNLLDILGVPASDIIFLRNVLIYFDQNTKKKILQCIHNLLKPDGYLFLGGSETTLNICDNFDQKVFDRTICYSRLSGEKNWKLAMKM